MMATMTEYLEPSADANAYTCPHCGVLAQAQLASFNPQFRSGNIVPVASWRATICTACYVEIAWREGEWVWPTGRVGPSAHSDMPDNIRAIYDEARDIGARSPRAAAALLRLALQKLLMDLAGGGDRNINQAIGALVRDGLPARVQRAMDVLRVVGNNAVHPGEIDLGDQPDTAGALFSLLNFVVEDRIRKPQEIDAVYASLPAGALEAIGRRDQDKDQTSDAASQGPAVGTD